MTRKLPAELARHLAQLLKRTRRRYRKRLERCQRNFSESAVHELRVETRRALALLDLMLALDRAGTPRKPRRTLKRRLDAFDALRDTQVELRLLEPWLKKFPEAREFEVFLRDSEQQLVAELRREIRALKSRRVERQFKALEKDVCMAGGNSTRPAVAFLQRPLRAAFARVVKLRGQVHRLDTTSIHRTRVAFKNFRYLCELFQPLLPDSSPARLRAMRDWQTRMGRIQDVEVLLCEIERAVRHGQVSLESVKRLHATLAQRLVLLVNRFISTADRLDQFKPQAGDRPQVQTHVAKLETGGKDAA
jgi:CHAD domain-containing protein